jgi:hypothetical protein
MKRILFFFAAMFSVLIAAAQNNLGSKQATFQSADGSEKVTYAVFHQKMADFFKGRKDLPKVAGLLRQVEPYLKKNLSKDDQARLKKILKDIEDLKERDEKTGKQVSILQTRQALGSYVGHLREELAGVPADMESDSVTEDATQAVPDTAANAALDTAVPVTKDTGSSPWFWWVLSGLGIVAAGALGFLYVGEKKQREAAEAKLAVLPIPPTPASSAVSLAELQKQVPQLIARIREHEKSAADYERIISENKTRWEADKKQYAQQIELLQAQLAEAQQQAPPLIPAAPVAAPEPPPAAAPEPVTEEQPAEEPAPEEPAEFYLSTPNKDGSFRDLRASRFDPSQSLYRVVQISPFEAEFEFVNDPILVSEALRYPETFLDPVCDYGGGIQYGARHILTIAKGRLLKTNIDADRWELQHKAIIRFEG